MKRLLVSVFCIILICPAMAQDFKFRIGLGAGIDMGLRMDRYLPPAHSLEYKNTATPTLDIFTKFSYKKLNFTPDFKISYGTFSHRKRKAVNENGSNIPEGTYISFVHSGDFSETTDRPAYLLDKTDVTLNTMSVGAFVTYSFFEGGTGHFEVGSGFFYFRKQVNFKDYMAHDIYDYYGSSGSHITQYQTDEYSFKETVRDKKPTEIHRVLFHLIQIPIIVAYDFSVGDYVELSPAFITYLGKDTYYAIELSISFGNLH
jgi:hypothetical protein